MQDLVLDDAIMQEYLGLRDRDLKDIINPFSVKADEFENPIEALVSLMMDPKYFYFFIKEVLNIEPAPFQLVMLEELWYRKYPMIVASRGASKSFTLALYAVMRAAICQGSKIVLIGAGFRQSKNLFNYVQTIWDRAPVLRDMFKGGGAHKDPDMWWFKLGDSQITALPVGDGEKIRGLRATHILCDEAKSQNKEIFDTVISGFAAVSANPVIGMKEAARRRILKKTGRYDPLLDIPDMGNQTVLAGTAYYTWNWFYDEFKKYKKIIESQGDPKKLTDIFPDGPNDKFDHRFFSIFRMPVELLPEGFMDEAQVEKSRATISTTSYLCEYGAVFPLDSNGFFKRSIIESCVTSNPIKLANGEEVQFKASLKGRSNRKHIIAVDPASKQDNFAIVVLEMNETHNRLVYAWTTNLNEHRSRIKAGNTEEKDFYKFCARKIRTLEKLFPAERIVIDAQGGGGSISEALHDADKLKHGEQPFWPIIEEDKPKDSDDEPGRHILELVEFSNSKYVSYINHGLKKDMEDKILLFPSFDAVTLIEAGSYDQANKREWDTLEECVLEIEELKDELSTIIQTETDTGREKWDTPEIKMEGMKKGRMRKDRYSALVMANGAARTLMRTAAPPDYLDNGGFASNEEESAGYANAPFWFMEKCENIFDIGMVVVRGR